MVYSDVKSRHTSEDKPLDLVVEPPFTPLGPDLSETQAHMSPSGCVVCHVKRPPNVRCLSRIQIHYIQLISKKDGFFPPNSKHQSGL